MRSAQKKTPVSEKKNGKEQTSGKKLVQARLPFKILAGTPPPSTSPDVSTPSSKLASLPKKRKLSYTEECENAKKIGKSDSKENLTTDKLDTTTDVASDPTEVVIVLDDEDLPDISKVLSPKTPIVTSRAKKSKSTPCSAGRSTTPKVLIKLPLSGKKKKRKSKISTQSPKPEATDSSDVEILSEELENPTKKTKLAENRDLCNGASPKEEQKEVDVYSNKNKKAGDLKRKAKTESTPNKVILSEDGSNVLEKDAKSCEKKQQVVAKDDKPSKDESIEIVVQPKPSPKKVNTPKKTLSKADSKKTRKQSTTTTKPEKVESVDHPKSSPMKEKTPSKPLPKAGSEKVTKTQTVVKNDKSEEIEMVEKPKTSPKKVNTPSKLLKPSAAESNFDSEENITPVRSRRSTRQSEAEQKKEDDRLSSDEKLMSETELLSDKQSAANTSITEINKKLLTPKQLKLMEQRKKAREEKELKLQQLKEERDRKLQEQREDRERKLQEEKMQKQKEREERELQRKKEREEKDEQKRREREEKEEQRRKEKEDKERKRLAEIEAKNEEKRKKDEAKDEERRKREEERRRKELEKEEEVNRKKKAAQAFTKFFVPKVVKALPEDDPDSREDAESVDSLAFRPFQVKGDMKLAPLVRRKFKQRSREKLDSFLKDTQKDKSALYVGELQSGNHVPLRGSKTVLKDNDDVILIENELENAAQAIDEPRLKPLQRYKAKFYSFRENRRPPFYGTWRKSSTVITPRRPFATDKNFFDYEVDSDDEWEEEEPGESLNGSEDEKDESDDEDYEVDNEWFVPHGHLSDEEMQNEDELGPDTSREAQKAKLKALQQEFAKEMKKKTEKIKPRLIGTIWEDENGNRPNLCPTVIWDSLCARAMMFCEPILVEEPEPTEPEPSTPPPEKQKRIKLNDELMCDLVRLIHGNRHSRVFLMKEYLEHVSSTCKTIKNGECLAPTKALIREKIDEISEWSIVDAITSKKKKKKKLCWVVSADVLDKYSLSKLGLRNEWSYKLQPKYDIDKDDTVADNKAQEDNIVAKNLETSKSTETVKKKPAKSGITKFAKAITNEEKQNQLTASSKPYAKNSPKTEKAKGSPQMKAKQTLAVATAENPPSSVPNKTPVAKKRVALLMSVAPGQEFSQTSKNALISKFLQKNKTKSLPSSSTAPVEDKSVGSVVTPMDVDEVVMLD